MDGPAAEYIDWSIFSQILEMDEDPKEREFSTSIISNYFEQAENTFDQMQTALTEHRLEDLSSLGHFLKGSSAALGLTKVQNSCEKIQHFGAMKDETGTVNVPDENLCLERIGEAFSAVKEEYKETQQFLRTYFKNTV
ncbi:hypothetical protein D0Z03_001499 [Geotrichum reessii]|nr:hypothetical protein D0Z03_001499 [Galactomyces reessii]